MIPDTIVTWKWKPKNHYHTSFSPETVNVLRDMVRRNFPHPHRFVCVTDDPEGIDKGIEIVPLGDLYADIPNPSLQNGPSCYRRLRMFGAEAESTFGKRFVSLDLDCVIVGEMASVWDRSEDFIAWGDTSRRNKYNGSMILLTAGSRTKVWEQFDPIESPKKTRHQGLLGSDQAWLHYCLGPNEPIWGRADGVYSFRNHLEDRPGRPSNMKLPENARIIFFHGNINPWDTEVREKYEWVSRHYRRTEEK